MDEFVSEPITPQRGTFDAGTMATGVPGLPVGFTWRGQAYAIVARLETWKQSGPEVGRSDGERYLRRHYSRLRMSDESVWTVYCLRHTAPGASPKRRWFLQSVASPDNPKSKIENPQ
jgi:hypothetical protein